MRHTRAHRAANQQGFSVIEMLVAVALFSIVMIVIISALLSIVESNRRARAIHESMSNLNFALDTMSRDIRTGYTYHCRGDNFVRDGSVRGSVTPGRNCSNGGAFLSLEPEDGDQSTENDQIMYNFTGSTIERSDDGGSTWAPLTSQNVTFETFSFYVTGAGRTRGRGPNNEEQPKVTITARGTVGAGETSSTFRIQTTVSQRLLDF